MNAINPSQLREFSRSVEQELDQSLASLNEHLSNVLWPLQEADGHWHFALDDNVTMNAEYILFHRWIRLSDEGLVQKLAKHLLNRQDPQTGAWVLFYGGRGNLSTTVEAYFALRAAGYSAEDPRLKKARDFILSQGGIPQARVFTKIWLALFNLYPWAGIPVIPPEILLAPRGLPFNIYEFSYWSRVTIIPLTLLFHLRKTQHLNFHLDELYVTPSDKQKIDFLVPPPVDDSWIVSRKIDFSWINWEQVFIALNKGVTAYEAKSPLKPLRPLCVEKARRWILNHQEPSGGWGGIQPPMLNCIMALHSLGMPLTAEPIQKGLEALHSFTRGVSSKIRPHANEQSDEAVLQSCVSPIWDTALGSLGLLEAGTSPHDPRLQKAREFLWENRITKRGDWAIKAKIRKDAPIAAWCFQYENTNYPDVDDSCVTTLVLHKLGMTKKELEPALNWIFGMQCTDGGWGTFDRDNNQVILNRIPFADLKSLIDPSNPDVTGHVLETLGELGFQNSTAVRRAIRYLKRVQKADGSWFGRWGVNYIYGTCAAVVGLRKVGEPVHAPYLERAIQFLLSKQNPDGGWGESCDSYALNAPHGEGHSTPSQTAWALMALEACRTNSGDYLDAIANGVNFLESRKAKDGLTELEFTGTGFPEHFYLRYDGYRTYFPLIAVGRLQRGSLAR